MYSKPNRKYLKYTVVKAIRDGYQVSQKSKFKVGANKASSRGGSFAVRKDRTTKVEISLEREGAAQQARVAPTPPTSGGSTNKGNTIIFAQTHHSYKYPLAQPDDMWMSNYTNSYYLGSVKPGWKVELVTLRSGGLTTPKDEYMFGLIRRDDGTEIGCAWLEPNTVQGPLRAYTNICSTHPFREPQQADEQINGMRVHYGKHFNCDKGDVIRGSIPNKCNSPITLDPQDMNPGCADPTLYRNYYMNNYKSGRFRDPVLDSSGNPFQVDLRTSDSLRYRFTTYDERAAVVAGAATYGWGFISRDCIIGNPTDKEYYEVRYPNVKYPPPSA